jgi:anti-anti-sigma factor
MAALSVEVDHDEDLWTIVLDGELDSSTALVLRQSVGEIQGPCKVDGNALGFVDTAGVGELVKLAKRTASVSFVNPPPRFTRLVHMMGLGEVFGLTQGVGR